MPRNIPTGELLVRRIILRKEHTELSDKMLESGPNVGRNNVEIIERRVNLKSELALIDKELKRRDSEQGNS